jgi:hypothetical protein
MTALNTRVIHTSVQPIRQNRCRLQGRSTTTASQAQYALTHEPVPHWRTDRERERREEQARERGSESGEGEGEE